MANPQIENGFIRIATELFEQLVNTPLLGSEFQVMLFIIRKTWGWGKKEDWITISQFKKSTGLSKPTIIKAIKNLVNRNIVVKTPLPDTQEISYKLNKNYHSWVVKGYLPVKQTHKTGKEIKQKLVKTPLPTIDTTINKQNGLDFIKKMREQIKAKKSI